MKFLLNHSPQKNRSNHRFIGVETRDAAEFGGGPEGRLEASLDRLRETPLLLRASDLTEISRGLSNSDINLREKMTPAHRTQFSELVNHHIDRLQSGSDRSMPSQMLFAIISNSQLAPFVTPSQRRVIDRLISAERKNIESIVNKSAEKWSTAESLRLMRSFRYTWGNRTGDKVYEKAVDKILNKSRGLIDLYKANGNALVPREGSQAGARKINSKEQFFILEVYRNFPTKNFWTNKKNAETYTTLKQAREDIRSKLFSGPKLKATPEHMLFWEILDDEFAAGEEGLTPDGVGKFVEESQKVRFMAQVSRRPMSSFTPAELALIKQIKSELEARSDDYLQKYEGFLEESEYAEIIDEYSKDQSKTNFNINKLEKSIRENTDNQAKLKSKFQDKIDFYSTDTDAFVRARLDGLADGTDKTEFTAEWNEIASPFAPGATDSAAKDGAQKKVASFGRRLWEKSKDHYENHQALETETKRLKLELEKENLLARLDENEKIEFKEIVSYYTDTGNQLEQIDKTHRANLTSRFSRQRLSTADLDLVREAYIEKASPADLRKNYNIEISFKLVDEFGAFCDEFSSIIDEAVGLSEGVKKIPQAKIKDIEGALASEELKSILVKTEFGPKIKEFARRFEMSSSVMLDFLTYTYRAEVLEHLPDPEQGTVFPAEEEKMFAKFFDSYSRQHQSIYSHDRLKNLEEKDIQHIGLKDAQSREAETQQTRIEQIFAHSTPIAIKTKILAPKMLPAKDTESAYAALVEVLGNHHMDTDLRSANEKKLIDEIKSALTPFVTSEALEDQEFLRAVIESFIAQIGRKEALEVFDQRHTLWQKGDRVSQLPEPERLELGRLFQHHEYEVSVANRRIKDLLGNVESALRKDEDPTRFANKLYNEFNNVFAPQWRVIADQFYGELQEHLEAQYGAGAYVDFIKQQRKSSEALLEGLGDKITEIKDGAHNGTLTKHDPGFKLFQTALDQLTSKFDFMQGEWATEAKGDTKASLVSLADSVYKLDENLGLHKLDGKAEAKAKFERRKQALHAKIKSYQSAGNKFLAYAERDLENLDDLKFKEIYGMGKDTVRQFTLQTRMGIGQFGEFSGVFLEDETYFDRWYEAYLGSSTRSDALAQMDIFDRIEKIVEESNLDQQTDDLTELVGHYQNNRPGMIKQFFQFAGSGWQVKWYSFKSIFEVFKRFWETRERAIQRRDEQMTAHLGAKVFGDSSVGQEFQKLENEKFEERVSDFKKRHERRNYNYLSTIIRTTKDKDELFAVVELMIDKGWMRFDDPDFLRALMRFQRKMTGFPVVNFSIPEDIELYTTQPEMVKLRVEKAFMSIWNDYPAWLRWKSDMKSKYKSQMDSVDADYQEEVQSGGVDRYCREIIEAWRRGDPIDTYEPYRFEGYIFKAFENAQMNGPSHRRIYYLVMGMALKHPKTGKTLLSPEAYRTLAMPLFNKVPYLDALTDSSSWKKDGQVVPPGTPGAEQRPWSYDDFQSWVADYFTGYSSRDRNSVDMNSHKFVNEVLMKTFNYRNRINKADFEGIDRDDFGALLPGGDYDRIGEIWSKASGERSKSDVESRYNYLSEFKAYFKATIDSYRKDFVYTDIDKSTPEFQKAKNDRLYEIGNMVRTSFMSFHKLAGNYNLNSERPPVILQRKYWEADQYPEILSNRDEIYSIVEGLGVSLSPRLKSFNAVKEYGGYTEQNGNAEEQQIHAILTGEAFFDLDRIEQMVDSYQAPGDAYEGFTGEVDERAKDKD